MNIEDQNVHVVHLIPYAGIGGVEIAARSLPAGWHGNLLFERQYLVSNSTVIPRTGEYHGPQTSLNDPRTYWHALWKLVRNPPDLLVASLWRGALVLIFLKLLRPHQRVALFLHSSFDVHFIDKLSNRLAMCFSDSIWCDSCATLQKRVPVNFQNRGRVISFLLNRRPLPDRRDPAPRFVFWGRLSAQKGLDRALRFFREVLHQESGASFTIIGPDDGQEDHLRTIVEEEDLVEHVFFKGPMQPEEIITEASRACFYLQTSPDEGMALSVVEAMQAGLVPVVTPVGEIARYCYDGQSAVFVHDDSAAIETVLGLLSDPERYWRMSRAAAEYWQEKALYRDDFLAAARELIDSGIRKPETHVLNSHLPRP